MIFIQPRQGRHPACVCRNQVGRCRAYGAQELIMERASPTARALGHRLPPLPGLEGISFWLAIPALPRWAKLCRPSGALRTRSQGRGVARRFRIVKLRGLSELDFVILAPRRNVGRLTWLKLREGFGTFHFLPGRNDRFYVAAGSILLRPDRRVSFAPTSRKGRCRRRFLKAMWRLSARVSRQS
jgi:hypothetical protein